MGCVYMRTDCTNSEKGSKRMYLVLRKREGWHYLGILMPGLAIEIDDVGMFECNASGGVSGL